MQEADEIDSARSGFRLVRQAEHEGDIFLLVLVS